MGSRNGMRGNFDSGGYSNPRFDALVDCIAVETNAATRQDLINQAMRLHAEDVGHIPPQQLAENDVPLRFARVGQ